MNVQKITVTVALALGIAVSTAWAQGCCGGKAPKGPQMMQAKQTKAVQKATVKINGGYSPAVINAKVGKPLEITFYRNEESSCGEQVVFKSLGIKKTVPNGKKVIVRFTPKKAGVIEFTCGMNMYKGKVVVK